MKLLAQLYVTLNQVYSPARFNRLYRLQFDPYETLTSGAEVRKRVIIELTPFMKQVHLLSTQ